MTLTSENAMAAHGLATAATAHSTIAAIQSAQESLAERLRAANQQRDDQVTNALLNYRNAVDSALGTYQRAMSALELGETPDDDDEE